MRLTSKDAPDLQLMTHIAPDQAIANGRRKLDLENLVPARAWLVHRLDDPSQSYYLIAFGEPSAAIGVCTINAQSGEMMSSATLPGSEPYRILDAPIARRAAGLPMDAAARLVWKSFPGSRSMLDPVWQLAGYGQTVYVDQRQKIWHSLEGSARGG